MTPLALALVSVTSVARRFISENVMEVKTKCVHQHYHILHPCSWLINSGLCAVVNVMLPLTTASYSALVMTVCPSNERESQRVSRLSTRAEKAICGKLERRCSLSLIAFPSSAGAGGALYAYNMMKNPRVAALAGGFSLAYAFAG